MTAKDVKGVLALLQAEYPASFARLTPELMRGKATMWAETFAKDDPTLVYAAVKSIIAGEAREFAPGIGEIRERMRELVTPEELSETEAWAMVSRACRNGTYGAEVEFAKLPPEVQDAVGSASQIREWASMDEETVQSVVASNFMRGFKSVKARRKTNELMPESVKALVGEAKRNRIAGGRDARALPSAGNREE